MSRETPEQWDETDLGSRLVVVVNVTSADLEGDGLCYGQGDSLFEVSRLCILEREYKISCYVRISNGQPMF